MRWSEDRKFLVEKVGVPLATAAIGGLIGVAGTYLATRASTEEKRPALEDFDCLSTNRVVDKDVLDAKESRGELEQESGFPPISQVRVRLIGKDGGAVETVDDPVFTRPGGEFFIDCESIPLNRFPMRVQLSRRDWQGCTLRTRKPFLLNHDGDDTSDPFLVSEVFARGKGRNNDPIFTRKCPRS